MLSAIWLASPRRHRRNLPVVNARTRPCHRNPNTRRTVVLSIRAPPSERCRRRNVLLPTTPSFVRSLRPAVAPPVRNIPRKCGLSVRRARACDYPKTTMTSARIRFSVLGVRTLDQCSISSHSSKAMLESGHESYVVSLILLWRFTNGDG